MKYLFLALLFIATPVMAEFKIDEGVRKPQSVVVAGNSVIDDDESAISSSSQDDAPDQSFDLNALPAVDDFPIAEPTTPDKPIDPFTTAPQVPKTKTVTKKVVKKTSPLKIQRSIADDRIDDSYVQDLIKQNFSFTNPIE